MSAGDMDPIRARHISVRSLVGSILLILGLLWWLALIAATFWLSDAVGGFLRVVIALSDSAA